MGKKCHFFTVTDPVKMTKNVTELWCILQPFSLRPRGEKEKANRYDLSA